MRNLNRLFYFSSVVGSATLGFQLSKVRDRTSFKTTIGTIHLSAQEEERLKQKSNHLGNELHILFIEKFGQDPSSAHNHLGYHPFVHKMMKIKPELGLMLHDIDGSCPPYESFDENGISSYYLGSCLSDIKRAKLRGEVIKLVKDELAKIETTTYGKETYVYEGARCVLDLTASPAPETTESSTPRVR